MAEELLGPDGQPIDLDAAEQVFNEAMAAPEPDERPDYPAPPRKDYGLKPDGTPKLAAGRPRKSAADKPRAGKVPDAPPAKAKGAGKPVSTDYSETLTSFGSAVWMGLAAVPVTHAQALAAVWKHQLGAQVQAWNVAAQQDAGVRRGVEKLAGGPVWVVGIAIATAPLVGAGVAIMRDPQVRADLAEQTRAEFGEFLKSASADRYEDQAPAEAAA